MKEALKKTLAFVVFLFVCQVATAYEFSAENSDGKTIGYSISSTGKTCRVAYVARNCEGSINIPSSVEYKGTTYSVTSIGESAFSYCSGLTSVAIPSSVSSIDYKAFYNCSGLTSITIPSSVTSIGYQAFSNCSGLTSITIPSSVTIISSFAFENCNNLKIVVNGSNLNIVKGSKENGYVAYYADNVYIGNAYVDGFVFYDTEKTKLKQYVGNANSLIIPNIITTIPDKFFADCYFITSVEIPSSVISVGKDIFSGCNNIKKATFGCSQETAMCVPRENLEEITLKSNIEKFTSYPFSDSRYLYQLTSYAAVPPMVTISQFMDTQLKDVEIIVPNDYLSKYKEARTWREFYYIRGADLPAEGDDGGSEVLLKGDMDGDGKITMSDANIIVNTYLGSE